MKKRMNPSREDGVALLVALMAMLLMSVLGAALVLTGSSETMIAGNFRSAQEELYAAEAALERTMDDLAAVPDWNVLLDGSTRSTFVDGAPSGSRTVPGGGAIDLNQIVDLANCWQATPCSASDLTANPAGNRPWGANNPVWQLYGYSPLDRILATGTIGSPDYVVVLVADDPSETDGNPMVDGVDPATNPGTGVVALRGEAFGPRGAHRVIELTVERLNANDPEGKPTRQPGVRILSWREVH